MTIYLFTILFQDAVNATKDFPELPLQMENKKVTSAALTEHNGLQGILSHIENMHYDRLELIQLLKNAELKPVV